jgi:hypothetical protein
MITGPAFENISWRTYISTSGISTGQTTDLCCKLIVFACLNAAIIPAVYMFFPGNLTILLTAGHAYLSFTETAGRSLEGM